METGIMAQTPEGYVPLTDHARRIGANPDVANRAARDALKRGEPFAVRCWVPLQPRPVWYVPPDCTWRPGPRGRPPKD